MKPCQLDLDYTNSITSRLYSPHQPQKKCSG